MLKHKYKLAFEKLDLETMKAFFNTGIDYINKFPGQKGFLGYLLRPQLVIEDFLYSITTKHNYLYTLSDSNRIYQKIMSTVWDKHSQALVVDAIPLLAEYMIEEDFIKMFHAITSRLEAFDCKGIFPFIIEKQSIELVKKVQYMMDKVVTYR